ncbi:MAG: HEAT repeat domain-containing protein [Gammaproteobacteria bacterium]|jgi:HEAT repeat protein
MVRVRLASLNAWFCAVCVLLTATFPTVILASDGIVNDAVAVARTLYQSENLYDQILGAGTLSDVGDPDALALLEEVARSSDIVYQRSAIDTLIGVQHPNGIDLIYRLAAEDQSFTQFLTQSLATNPREDMTDFLLSLLRDSKPVVQQYAIQALVHQKDSDAAIQVVSEVISAPDVLLTTRAYGYYYLAQKGRGGEVEKQLLDVVATGDMNQREVAAVALRYLDTAASREALVRLQRSTDARVSLAAMSSQAALGNEQSIAELLNVIARGKSLNAEVGASAIRRLPPELAYELSIKLFALNLRADPGSRLLESWRAIDWDASDVYAWGLANKNVDVRMQTIWLIGQRQERGRLEELAAFLTDEDPRIRGMAAWAIVHIAPEQYTPGTKV